MEKNIYLSIGVIAIIILLPISMLDITNGNYFIGVLNLFNISLIANALRPIIRLDNSNNKKK
ncbi:MAG: hypothetical protein ACK5LV_01185 [Lachnospirales bacterium]